MDCELLNNSDFKGLINETCDGAVQPVVKERMNLAVAELIIPAMDCELLTNSNFKGLINEENYSLSVPRQ